MAGTDIVELTAGDVMHAGCECVGTHDTLIEAARMMDRLGVGALPICGEDEHLIGMLTDRDIVIKCLAAGHDPQDMCAGDLAEGPVIWAPEQMNIHEVLRLMERHQIRRVPVIDADKRLVGLLSQADIARRLGHELTGELLEAVSRGPAVQHAV